MGCTSSKLDGFPAVALCRHRCNFLVEALHRSYAVAYAHSAYLHSLRTVGEVLHRFFDEAVESHLEGDSGTRESPGCCYPAEGKRSRGRDCDLFGCAKQETINSDHEHDPFASMAYMKNEAARSVLYSGYGSDSHRNYDSGTRTPPPPPAPSSHAWDFINFFDNYEFPYSVTVKDSKDEEASCDHDDVSMRKTPKNETSHGNNTEGKEKSSLNFSEKSHYEAKKKKKKKSNDSEKNKEYTKKCDSIESKSRNFGPNVSNVTKELQEMFMKASEAGDEVSKMFDTAKFRYYCKSSVYQASSNILYAISPSILRVSSPSSEKMKPIDQNPFEDIEPDFRSLSSTLKKLFLWEKKLYQEVKSEEKLRTAHMKNLNQLKRLEEKGTTDVSKVEATRTLIRSLSTRMKVSIHAIDKICVTINTLRDEELWPLMKELINRLSKMWSSMLACHKRQSCIIREARKLEEIALKGNLDMAQLELAVELKAEFRNWSQSLSNWINAQKQCVKALNGWLMQCSMQEPHELTTPDLAEAPLVFKAINHWSQALERSSENEFTDAVYALLTQMNRQMEKQRDQMQQRSVIGGDDVERKLLMLEKEEQKMQRYSAQTLQQRMNILSVESTVSSNLKSNLEQIFTSLAKLATDSKRGYDDLYQSVCA